MGHFLQHGEISFFTFQDSFWKEALTNGKVIGFPKVYESVFVIAPSSYGEGTGDDGFRKQVYQRLRRPPFQSSIATEDQVWWRFLYNFAFIFLISAHPNPASHTHHCLPQPEGNTVLMFLHEIHTHDHRGVGVTG